MFRSFLRRVIPPLFAVSIVLGAAFLFFNQAAFAQSTAGAQQNVQQIAQEAGVGGSTDLMQIIGRVINIFLGFLGVIFLGLMLYAGFLWMTAGGDAEKVEQAKHSIRNAVIGLVIIALSWAIVTFVFNALIGATGGGGSGGPGGGGPGSGGFPTGAGSLGGGIVESHIPSRNAVDVPRNAPIMVTFRKPIRIASVIRDYNDNGTPIDLSDDTATEGVNDAAIKIYRTDAGVATALPTDQVRVRFTADRRTFVFRPVQLLGTATAPTSYTVELNGGRDGVLLENGDLAFGGAFASGYDWQFEVGTLSDTTPPRVVSVIPPTGNLVARNAIVQITFSEAIDPTSATGLVSGGQGFQNIRMHSGGVATAPLDGEYRIGNQYRTVEFIPNTSCGRNSCGVDMFCLPGASTVDAIVKAATLDGTGPAAQFVQSGYDGVVDMVGNSLDGNANGTAQGPGADDYTWAFGTSDEINRTPPTIEETTPSADPMDPGQSNIDPFAPIIARFDSPILSSTVNGETASILAQEPTFMIDTFWWTSRVEPLQADNTPMTEPGDIAAKSQVLIDHRMFGATTEYDPFLHSGIQNIYQNCFNPAVGPACPAGPGGVNCCQGTRQSAVCQFP